jgi:iron complex outermembrane receptor protein
MDPVTSYIEPGNLKKITIKQGTGSNHTGCNVGGSVDMTLQEPDELSQKPFYASLIAGGESVSRGSNLLFTTGFGGRKWGWGLDGVYRKNENYKDGNGREILFSQYEKVNLHSVFVYRADSLKTFKTDLLYDDARDVGYPALPMDVGVARAVLAALEYSSKGRNPLKIKLYYNNVYHVMDDSKRDSLYLLKQAPAGKSDTVYMRMDMPGESATWGGYVQYSSVWSRRNRMILKAENYTNRSVADMTMKMRYAGSKPEMPMYMQTWPDMMRTSTGLFVENSTFLSNSITASVNGRIDYYSDILKSEYGKNQFSVFNYNLKNRTDRWVKSINLSAQYSISKQTILLASTGYGERMPTIGERFGYYLYNAYDGYDYIGNPYIRSEKAFFSRLAFQHGDGKIKLNGSASYSKVNDYILGLTNSSVQPMNFYAHGIREYKNMDFAEMYSIDIQALYNPIVPVTLFADLKYTYATLCTGEAVPLMPPLKTVFAIQYLSKRISVQSEVESSLSQHRINENYGERVTSGYWVANCKASYSFKMAKSIFEVGAGVTNMFDKAYSEHLDWGRINRPGRSINMLLKYEY